MKCSTYRNPALTLFALIVHGGCTGISIAPSCPNELAVGESAPLLANEINPGAIAKYKWEVVPSQIGQVADPTMPSTMLKGLAEGDAVIRLTASDGLYQVISQCQTHVTAASQPPGGSGNGNSNDNTNANNNTNTNTNTNTNDNKGGNTNDNSGGRPPRGSRSKITPTTPP